MYGDKRQGGKPAADVSGKNADLARAAPELGDHHVVGERSGGAAGGSAGAGNRRAHPGTGSRVSPQRQMGERAVEGIGADRHGIFESPNPVSARRVDAVVRRT